MSKSKLVFPLSNEGYFGLIALLVKSYHESNRSTFFWDTRYILSCKHLFVNLQPAKFTSRGITDQKIGLN